MNLIIVESPTKAKTISHFLGGDFIIKSSYGHVRDLPKSDLGIDTAHDFKPKYIIPTKAKKNVTALKKDAEKSDTIILATDGDREGEAIAWHLVAALGLEKSKNKKENNGKKIERIIFHEITKKAIENALKNPRDIDINLVDAQQARRVLDRLVGYKLSPFLWKKFYRGLSAGRVQSVAVRLIVEREKEIEKFVPEEYWSIDVSLESESDKSKPLLAQLTKIGDKALEKLSIKNEKEAANITNDLNGAKYVVDNIEKNEVTRSPYGPFTTSTLQQDAAKKLHFSSKQTMMLAQQLYEGIEMAGESVGLITYMRTDSVSLSEDSLANAKSFIEQNLGKQYHHPRRFKTKSKNAQEAHEAIRPTDPHRAPDSLKSHLSPQQLKLYNLIWRRFMASQMSPAVFDATGIDIKAKNYTFRSNGSVMKFDGFLKIYPTKFEDNPLPQVKNKEGLKLLELKPEQHATKPPARFNEASIIKTLEKEGIGRPSTYAPIISTILKRAYVEKDRSRYFHPTEIGVKVNDFLTEQFPEIVDVKFTAHMEDDLDDIALGKTKWVPVIRAFYKPFEEKLETKMEQVKEEKAEVEKTDKICDKCGSPMVVRYGRFGKFIACSNFPKCKNILKEEKEKVEPELAGEVCDKCGGQMVFRHGRFGKFMACSNFPKCKNTKKIAQENQPEKIPPKAE